MKRLLLFSALVACLAVKPGAAPQTPAVHFKLREPAPKLLSSFHLFKDNAKQIPNDRVIPYDLNTPLFSDYATKHRFVWMPRGKSAKYEPTEAFDFPRGTILVKTFSFLNDIRDPSKGERLIETRLLINRKWGWEPLVYVWNDDASEATLQVVGGTADVSWTHYDGAPRSNNYIIPNTNQCKQCHVIGKVDLPIGPKARHLNKDYPYSTGTENQLTHWAKAGYLKGVPENPPREATWNDPHSGSLDERARAWLDINCAHCHNPEGYASNSGLDLRSFQDDPTKYGVMKTPVATGKASGNRLFGIVPGKPEESILLLRLESVDPATMMPQLPRRMIDEEGVALIREWIAAIKPHGDGGATAQ